MSVSWNNILDQLGCFNHRSLLHGWMTTSISLHALQFIRTQKLFQNYHHHFLICDMLFQYKKQKYLKIKSKATLFCPHYVFVVFHTVYFGMECYINVSTEE